MFIYTNPKQTLGAQIVALFNVLQRHTVLGTSKILRRAIRQSRNTSRYEARCRR